eukprot:7289709-Alexandrium_andersonii.AAC.1
MDLDPALSDDELFQTCLERDGQYTFLTSFAQRKEKKRDEALQDLQQECSRRGMAADTFMPAPRQRSRPPPPVEPVGA